MDLVLVIYYKLLVVMDLVLIYKLLVVMDLVLVLYTTGSNGFSACFIYYW